MSPLGAHVWTVHEVARLKRLRDAVGLDWEAIGFDLGMTAAKCYSKYEAENYRLRRLQGPVPNRALRASDHQELDREARSLAADRRTITQRFFGDPAPGFSELDKRQKASQ